MLRTGYGLNRESSAEVLFRRIRDCVKTNTSAIVIPTPPTRGKLQCESRLDLQNMDPRFRGDDISLDFLHSLHPIGKGLLRKKTRRAGSTNEHHFSYGEEFTALQGVEINTGGKLRRVKGNSILSSILDVFNKSGNLAPDYIIDL